MVVDDGFLLFRKVIEQLLELCRTDVAFNLSCAVALEIFVNEQAVVHVEIIVHIAQGGIIVFHHQVGIFADDVDLLYFLLVEFVEHAVVVLFVAHAVVHLFAVDGHGVVEHEKSSLQF